MEFFNKLGALVERLWKEKNYSEQDFATVAVRALDEFPPDRHVSFRDTVRWGLTAEPLLPQHDIAAEFGQPPLTVYWGDAFFVEVLFWIRGLPAIHQHCFSGAFHVMHGSSLHTIWSFQAERRVSVRLMYGSLALQRAELLCRGDTRQIVAGKDFIHATLHLDCPSVSIIIRTIREQDKLPQYSYIPPSIAYDTQEPIPSVERRVQLLGMLLKSNKHQECAEMMYELIRNADSYSLLQYLMQAQPLFNDKSVLRDLLSVARAKDPEFVARLEPALLYLDRRDKILKLREKASNPELQYFLAVLLYISDRSAVLRMLHQRFPSEDSVSVAVRAMQRLSELGVLEIYLADDSPGMVNSLLSGLSERDIYDSVNQSQGVDQARAKLADLRRLVAVLKRNWLLAPLFSEDQSTIVAGVGH